MKSIFVLHPIYLSLRLQWRSDLILTHIYAEIKKSSPTFEQHCKWPKHPVSPHSVSVLYVF